MAVAPLIESEQRIGKKGALPVLAAPLKLRAAHIDNGLHLESMFRAAALQTIEAGGLDIIAFLFAAYDTAAECGIKFRGLRIGPARTQAHYRPPALAYQLCRPFVGGARRILAQENTLKISEQGIHYRSVAQFADE